jgi:DNA-binding NarL/FixJ family response regulator
MFRRVLLAEGMDGSNIGLAKTLSNAFSFKIDQTQYGDKALLMVKKALMDSEPYDLLITDLSFNNHVDKPQIPDGESLIGKAKSLQPDLKSIIYSIEDRPHKIRRYLDSLQVDAYVLKGRESAIQMVEAIQALDEGECYLSPELSELLQLSSSLEIDEYDLLLMTSLSEGYSQQEISKRFKKQGVSPHSLSSIEKRINRLKEALSARNIPNLIALAKDMGLI